MFNKKVVILFLLLTSAIVGVFFLFQDTGSLTMFGFNYNDVYVGEYGNMKCLQHDDYNIRIIKYLDQQTSIKCDHYTNECEILVSPDRDFSFLNGGKSFRYRICNIGKSCDSSWVFQSFPAPAKESEFKRYILDYGQEFQIDSTFLNGGDLKYLISTKKVKTFYLEGNERGEIFQQESCILDSSIKKRVLADGKNELQFGEFQNYLIGYENVATKIYDYKSKDVICSAKRLYNIHYEDMLDGSTIKFQGDFIKSVECCPSEPNCDKNTFEYVDNNERKCFQDLECVNGGHELIVSGTSYTKTSCINNLCVMSEEIYTECTNDNICIAKYGDNSVCDLSPNNFGTCKDNTDRTGFCGDNVCDSVLGETKVSCPSDCGYPEEKTGIGIGWFILASVLVLVIGGFILKRR